MPESEILRRLAVMELVQNWAVWRDAGDWERFKTCWHEDGFMMATWCQAPAAQFIAASQAGWAKGVSILHFLGGNSVDVQGKRAISQTKMTISQRAEVEGVLVDVVCTGRFYDFVEERDGRWGIVLRQPIYEKDRMDPVDPAARLELDKELLARFPEGYRHLAYLQTRIGYDVKRDMPGLKGERVEALYRAGISPRRSAHTVAGARAARLAPAIKAVLTEAIAAGGSSLRDYVRADGEIGRFQENFAVYGREGEACPGCPGKADCPGIKRIVQSGRSSFFCPVRQR